MRTVALDVSPLLESKWTGIPIFTARLARGLLLLAVPEIRTLFSIGADAVDTNAVISALNSGTGLCFRADYVRRRNIALNQARHVDAALYPTVKSRGGCLARE